MASERPPQTANKRSVIKTTSALPQPRRLQEALHRDSDNSLRQCWIEAPAMAPGGLPAFPEETSFSYLAEGAANIVYRFSIHPRTPEPSLIEEYGEGTPPPSIIDDSPASFWERPYEGKSSLLFRYALQAATRSTV